MTTYVRDLMSSPAVTCGGDASLAAAARTMSEAATGSVVVAEVAKVIGILTERDLLRAAAAGAEPDSEPVRLWMTEGPDVLGPDEEVGAAWSSLTDHHYRHLPVVDGDALVGVVSPARPDQDRQAASGGRDSFAGSAGPRGGRDRGDLGGRCPWARRLLPLPPVLGRRPRVLQIVRGRLVPDAFWLTTGPVRVRRVRSAGERATVPAAGAEGSSASVVSERKRSRRAPDIGVGPRCRARLGADPGHRL